jgi:hypothetical protein
MKTTLKSLLRLLALAPAWALAEDAPGAPASTNVRCAEYPRVLADRRVVIMIKAPNAQKVQFDLGRRYLAEISDDGTRAWKTAGEGDIRYAKKGDTLNAIVERPAAGILVVLPALAQGKAPAGKIGKSRMAWLKRRRRIHAGQYRPESETARHVAQPVRLRAQDHPSESQMSLAPSARP